MEMVDPFVLMITPPTPTKLEVAGALILTTLPFVPESVRLIPEYPMVDPLAVVLPAVLAPSRLTQLFSAAAPGAATEAVIMDPADVPNVTLFALLNARVVNEKDPFEAEATGVTPPPAPTLIARPLLFSVIEAFVALVPVPA